MCIRIYYSIKASYSKLLQTENLSRCEIFCEKSFSKRKHDSTQEVGAWFCRGLWKHNSDKEGGCKYWTREDASSLNSCKNECSSAGFGGFGNWIISRANGNGRISETDMCKKGCEWGGND